MKPFIMDLALCRVHSYAIEARGTESIFLQSFYLYILHTVAYLTAEVAKTWPLEPTDSTIIEATTTIRSALIENEGS